MTGTTPAAWNDPVKGSELTKAQISQGSDVVFAAAGGTGVGVLQTAADEGILSIGVDSNQNYLHPGQGSDIHAQARRQRCVSKHVSKALTSRQAFNVMGIAEWR